MNDYRPFNFHNRGLIFVNEIKFKQNYYYV